MKQRNQRFVPASLLAAGLLSGVVTPVAWGLPMLGFPDADPDSGQFVTVTRGLSSLGDVGTAQNTINISLAVPASLATFRLHIFDGDDTAKSHWDVVAGGSADEMAFKLFRDPQLVSNTDPDDLLHWWSASTMPDDQWCELGPGQPGQCSADAVLTQDMGACPNGSLGNCYYHLVGDWVAQTVASEQNAFKVAVEGQPFLRAGSTIGFEVLGCNSSEVPNCVALINQYSDIKIRAVNYSGSLSFDFLVKDPATQITLFDGDADRDCGAIGCITEPSDSDDANSPSCDPFVGTGTTRNTTCSMGVADTTPYVDTICESDPGDCILTPSQPGVAGVVLYPPFQVSPLTEPEGARPGMPVDDSWWPIYRKTPAVRYEVSAPGSAWTVSNDNPSGDSEWEQFIIRDGTPPLSGVPAADVAPVASIPTGFYNWKFIGLDYRNTLFVHAEYDVYPSDMPMCPLEIVKTCSTPSDPVASSSCVAKGGEGVDYGYTVTNGSEEAMVVTLLDNRLGVVASDVTIPPGNSQFSKHLTAVYDDTENAVTVTGMVDEVQCVANSFARVRVNGGGQGCTPGYWRQTKTYPLWAQAGYDPTANYYSVFGVGYGSDPANTSISLWDVVRLGGGGYANLGRHSVAALLNAASARVDYLFTAEEVIARVQAAYSSGDLRIIEATATTFQAQNDLGAPICR